jgi:hypothetical protein
VATLYFTIFAWFQRGVYENFEARRLKTVAHLAVTLANAPLVICVRTAVPSSDIEQQPKFIHQSTRFCIVARDRKLWKGQLDWLRSYNRHSVCDAASARTPLA